MNQTFRKSFSLQPEFKPAVESIIQAYWRQFGNLTHSLYLYGSVLQGRAVFGTSDLDLSVVFHQAIDPSTRAKLTAFERDMTERFNGFSKVELDIGTFNEVMASNDYQWQYWLKNYCVAMKGDDLSEVIADQTASIEIVLAMNKDIQKRLQTTCRQLESEFSSEALKSICKKLIRVHYDLTFKPCEAWRLAIDELVKQLSSQQPQFQAELADIGRYASTTTDPVSVKLSLVYRYGERVIKLFTKRNQQLGFPVTLETP